MTNFNCSGSHHKSRSGTRSSLESFAKSQEARRRKEIESKRLRRCLDQVLNFTFRNHHFEELPNTEKDPVVLVGNPQVIPFLPGVQTEEHPQFKKKSGRRSKKRRARSASNEEGSTCDDDNSAIAMAMSSDDPLASEDFLSLYEKDEEPLLCSLYGDPHLRTFGNTFQTCRILGAWPLVDHPLFAVQVTNSRTSGGQQVSRVTKAVIIIRNFLICGIDHDLVYEVDLEEDYETDGHVRNEYHKPLPITFIDGTTSTLNGLVKVTPRSEDVVCIQVDHVRVQICVSRFTSSSITTGSSAPSQFLNVIVKFKKMMSSEERDLMISAMDAESLCSRGCPAQEEINIESILQAVGINPLSLVSNGWWNHHGNISTPSSNNSEIPEECKDLLGYYLLSCLFDVTMKGVGKGSIEAHRFAQGMDDLLIVKRSYSLKSLLMSSVSSGEQSTSCRAVISQFFVTLFAMILFFR